MKVDSRREVDKVLSLTLFGGHTMAQIEIATSHSPVDVP